MQKIILLSLSIVLSIGFSLQGSSQVAVVPLGDDFFILPVAQSGPCEVRVIPSFARMVDSGDARVIIASDMAGIGGITASDPDDIQSLVHMLTFADRVDIEGITTSPPRSRFVSNNTQSRARIMDIINAYGQDRSRLRSNFGNDFPTTSALRNTVADGSVEYHPITANSAYNNQAVQRIIERARCGFANGDRRPLYLLGWGSLQDVAQAIFLAPDILRVIRVVSFSRGNNGVFARRFVCGNHGTDIPNFQFSCAAWNFLRAQQDIWWVDFTGRGGPMHLCDTATINDIRAGGALGSRIIDNHEPPFNQECSDRFGGTLTTDDWLKMGDTWTLMFTHNPASQRNDPLANLTYGRFSQPNPGRTYWQMFVGEFQNRSRVYVDWRARANRL